MTEGGCECTCHQPYTRDAIERAEARVEDLLSAGEEFARVYSRDFVERIVAQVRDALQEDW